MTTLPVIDVFRGELGDFANACGREWLVTNGIGGFACGTVSGARTRRYHGLLTAALKPPLERTLLIANVEVSARYGDASFSLATNEFHDETIHPVGYVFIDHFRVQGMVPIWRYLIGDAVLEQSVWMAHGANTTYVRLSLPRASASLTLDLAPLCTYRDYHSLNRGEREFKVEAIAQGIEIAAFDGATAYRITTDRGHYTPAPVWYWGFRHRVESCRGLDDLEDLFHPGIFSAVLAPGESITLTITTEPNPESGEKALTRLRTRTQDLLRAAPADSPEWIRALSLATDQFIVSRSSEQQDGKTVIAGYPWFGDWGRDTMIALPGLTLATRHFDTAAQVLRTFARHVDRGMLPNRFPDSGEIPEYNTVDATLWFFHAIDHYLRYSGAREIVGELYPVLVDIIDWHERGTRFGIGVDPDDGLIKAGETGAQLTWMDAKVGDWVVTPRIGKPVEINALWYAALVTAQTLAKELKDRPNARRFRNMAARVVSEFQSRYWSESLGYLHDVIDGPDCMVLPDGRRADPSLRPNQIIALAVAPDLVERAIARRVVDHCARKLWTPVGLRSLAADHPNYIGRYRGGPRERDGSYHQGTVWSWLLGPFALAHFNAYADAAAARGWLEGIAGHLHEACIGQVSEIFDGDPPYHPAGCFAQAWGVAEVLRAWMEIGLPDAMAKGETRK